MTVEEALAIVDGLIQPARLTTLQEIIFRSCWENQTYQQIAENSDYDADYIRVTGSRLWQIISEVCQEKVTKSNFRSILRQKSSNITPSNITLELPDGPVPIKSNFYIERPPIEQNCYQEIAQPGALLRIKAPRNMGKTSLLDRIVTVNNVDYYGIKLDLQQADKNILSNFSRLLRWLCANICNRLGIENLIDEYWDEDLGIKVSCTAYVQGYILEQLDKPLILALDQLQVIFEHTEVAQEFLPLLRFWHEEAKNLPVWQKLRLIVVQSTESYVPLNFNQSPFNVGLSINLPEFNQEQIINLAIKHQLNRENNFIEQEIPKLIRLIGGHPYLVRLAFYNLAKYNLTITQLIREAPTETSIYIDMLRYYLGILYDNEILARAYKEVILSDHPIQLESFIAYQLESLGLICLQENEASPTCELYRLYFEDRLNQF